MSSDFRPDATRSAAGVNVLLQQARDEGLDLCRLYQGSGCSAETLLDPESELGIRQELRIIENLLRERPSPGFAARVGRRFRTGTFGVLGYALLSASNLREAIETMVRYQRLSPTLVSLHADECDGTTFVVLRADGIPVGLRHFVMARDLAALLGFYQEVAGTPLQPRRLWLSIPPREACAEFVSLVKGCVPAYGKPNTVIAIDSRELERPFARANALAFRQCERLCCEIMEAREDAYNLPGKIRILLRRQAAEMPTIEDVATHLFMTSRTLRRRLAQAGISYRELVEDVRRDMVKKLLMDGDLPLHEVAQRLGYQDATSFNTAFKGWFGVPPARFRREQTSLHRSEEGAA